MGLMSAIGFGSCVSNEKGYYERVCDGSCWNGTGIHQRLSRSQSIAHFIFESPTEHK
jgi:hypothetical protein